MLRRLIALGVLAWIFGFAWFATALPQPAPAAATDAVVVLTGLGGRIPRGLEAVRKGWAPHLFVSGVDKDVTAREFAAEYDVPAAMMACCVTLGYDAYDTRTNAREVTDWLTRNDVSSVRLVTTDWHMRRAAWDFDNTAPAQVNVLRDAVPSQPSLRILFLEYNKLIARVLFGWWERR